MNLTGTLQTVKFLLLWEFHKILSTPLNGFIEEIFDRRRLVGFRDEPFREGGAVLCLKRATPCVLTNDRHMKIPQAALPLIVLE